MDHLCQRIPINAPSAHMTLTAMGYLRVSNDTRRYPMDQIGIVVQEARAVPQPDASTE